MKKIFFYLLLATTIFAQSITLAWNDNSSDETGFKIERSIDGGTFQQIGIVGSNVTTFSDDIQIGKKYTYRVCAYNSAGTSSYSTPLDVLLPTNSPSNMKIIIEIK